MFSTLATFLFGAQPSSESTNSEGHPDERGQPEGKEQKGADVIEVTSSTPSVAGGSRGTLTPSNKKRGGSGKNNRRGKQRQQAAQRKPAPTLTKLLTPGDNGAEDHSDSDDEWFIVEKEDEENESLPRSDSEGELCRSVVKVQAKAAVAAGPRRVQRLHSHSLYNGHYLQRPRAALHISTLSPPRSVPGGVAVTQSLYAPSPCGSDHEAGVLMDESWYVTPPPCFTSIGPINMETSPLENLLIEHPSMSVYHSIRSSQEATDTERFVSLDLEELQAPAPAPDQPAASQALVPRRPISARNDRHAAMQLKQQTLARQGQQSKNKKQQQELGRSAIKRTNKVRDPKAYRQRRSDLQHCKHISGANNNRKCCY